MPTYRFVTRLANRNTHPQLATLTYQHPTASARTQTSAHILASSTPPVQPAYSQAWPPAGTLAPTWLARQSKGRSGATPMQTPPQVPAWNPARQQEIGKRQRHPRADTSACRRACAAVDAPSMSIHSDATATTERDHAGGFVQTRQERTRTKHRARSNALSAGSSVSTMGVRDKSWADACAEDGRRSGLRPATCVRLVQSIVRAEQAIQHIPHISWKQRRTHKVELTLESMPGSSAVREQLQRRSPPPAAEAHSSTSLPIFGVNGAS
jgi:hypothetical protein